MTFGLSAGPRGVAVAEVAHAPPHLRAAVMAAGQRTVGQSCEAFTCMCEGVTGGCDPVHFSRAKRVVSLTRGKRHAMMIKLGSIMPPFIFDLIYREFMRARLAEMRRQLFLVHRDLPEVDTDQPDNAADQGSDDSHWPRETSRHA